MDEKRLKSLYDNLVLDVDFDTLDLGLKNPNIFQILNITRAEIRHSNFLAWLMDPNQSHKLGDIFLKRFLREVFSSDRFGHVDQIDVEAMDLSKAVILREWRNIDILIKLPDVIVCIENKVLSQEHSNQLQRYREIVEENFPEHRHTYVYLNPQGFTSDNEWESYEPISYDFVVNTLDRIMSVYGESMNPQIKYMINDYTTIVKRELMETDQLTELARKIYENHKELLDFVYERKPEIVDRLSDAIIKELGPRGWIQGSENKYFVRFLTPAIKDLIYFNQRKKNGWRNKESFLFEINFYPGAKKLHFKTTIAPCDEGYDTKRLEEMLLEIDGFRAAYGKQWLVNKDIQKKINFDDLLSMSTEELDSLVQDFLDKISPIVKKVEDKLLEHKEELLEMKNTVNGE